MAYADAYLGLGDKKLALEAGEKAYSLDITMLPVYELLGKLYMENGDYGRAVEALELYVVYVPDDATAFALIGQAHYELKEYKAAVEHLDQAYKLNPNGLRKYYIYRGLANLELNNIDQAVSDLEEAISFDDQSFEANLGLVRGYYAQEKFGSSFLRMETITSLADTDEETALALYWRGRIQEKRDELPDAIKAWQDLLAMDPKVMTPEMRKEAQDKLKIYVTPTVSPTPGKAPTKTPTPKAGGAASATPRPGGSATAAKTQTSAPGTPRTPTPTVTRTPTPTPTK
jgi:tetratricopeptide (TPR) repeat protein